MEVSTPPIDMGSGFLVDKAPGALRSKLIILALLIVSVVVVLGLLWKTHNWWLDHTNISYGILGLLGLGATSLALRNLYRIEKRVDPDYNGILGEFSAVLAGVLLLALLFAALMLVAIFSR